MSDNTDKVPELKESKLRMLKALEKSLGVVTPAATAANISRETHYKWMREDPAYKDKVDDMLNISLDFAETALYRKIRAGDVRATVFYLSTRGKDRGYITRQEHTGAKGAPLHPLDFKNETKESLKDALDRLEKEGSSKADQG